ncbi:MAG: hypothetical protein ACOY81_02180, partial [Bacillota bacterium]
HRANIKALRNICRVILVTASEDPLLPWSVAVGVHDILLTPLELPALLYRIQHPATLDDATGLLEKLSGPSERLHEKVDSQEQVGGHDTGQGAEEPRREIKLPRLEVKLPEVKLPEMKLPEITLPRIGRGSDKNSGRNRVKETQNALIFHGNHGVGVTSILLAAARTLCLHREVAIIDANFKYPDIGLKTGIPAGMIPPLDWRIRGAHAAINTGGFFVFPLDPTVSVDHGNLAKITGEALKLVGENGLVLIDAGDNRPDVKGTSIAIIAPEAYREITEGAEGDMVIINKASPLGGHLGDRNSGEDKKVIGTIPYEAEAVVNLKAGEIFLNLFSTNGKGGKKHWNPR